MGTCAEKGGSVSDEGGKRNNGCVGCNNQIGPDTSILEKEEENSRAGGAYCATGANGGWGEHLPCAKGRDKAGKKKKGVSETFGWEGPEQCTRDGDPKRKK